MFDDIIHNYSSALVETDEINPDYCIKLELCEIDSDSKKKMFFQFLMMERLQTKKTLLFRRYMIVKSTIWS